jgi:hypothetical protein
MAEPVVQDGFVNCTGTEHNDECSYAHVTVKRLGYRSGRCSMQRSGFNQHA